MPDGLLTAFCGMLSQSYTSEAKRRTGLSEGFEKEYKQLAEIDHELLMKHIQKSDLLGREKMYLEELVRRNTWIPCSERMPDDGQEVIGCDRSGFITRFRYDADDPPCWIDDHEEFFYAGEIIAWMPLPEPPEREEKK